MINFEDHYGHWALVVNPGRDVEQYLGGAEGERIRITHVTETHINADFVSGSREVASLGGYADWQAGGNPTEREVPEPRRLL